MNRAALLFAAGALLPAVAQQTQPLVSPEVHANRSVTFRLRSPYAREVFLAREGAERIAMQKDAAGVWSVTTAALAPDLYGYSFIADGVALIDPSNSLIKPNLLNPQSLVHVPGEGLPWEVANVGRGTVHRHFYHSNLIGDDRDFFVYTPPNYDRENASIRCCICCTDSATTQADGRRPAARM